MRARDAKGDKILQIRRDNLTAGDFWILADGHDVTVCAQQPGHAATASVTIPRKEFNRLVDWYMRDQKPTKRG